MALSNPIRTSSRAGHGAADGDRGGVRARPLEDGEGGREQTWDSSTSRAPESSASSWRSGSLPTARSRTASTGPPPAPRSRGRSTCNCCGLPPQPTRRARISLTWCSRAGCRTRSRGVLRQIPMTIGTSITNVSVIFALEFTGAVTELPSTFGSSRPDIRLSSVPGPTASTTRRSTTSPPRHRRITSSTRATTG